MLHAETQSNLYPLNPPQNFAPLKSPNYFCLPLWVVYNAGPI